MSAELVDGKRLAASIREAEAPRIEALVAAGHHPTLAIVIAASDPSSDWYVRSLSRAGSKIGLDVRVEALDPGADAAAIADRIRAVGDDRDVHGIIVQTPLPAGCRLDDVSHAIPVEKDIDGANPLSAGRLLAGLAAFAPATARAVMEMLLDVGFGLAGRSAVVVGRSLVVGKPVANLLLAQNATVTVCHSRTADLASVTRTGDVLVAAAGRPGMITSEHVRPGAVVIDVGTTANEAGEITGDVEADGVRAVAGALSPVPGGVGPVTTAVLLRQVREACSALTG